MRKPPLILSVATLGVAVLGLFTCSDPTGLSPNRSEFSSTTIAPVLLAAGDIGGCDHNLGDQQTAALINTMPDATIVTLGDNAYDSGTATEYVNCYQPSWGQFKARTRPTLGNHEYNTGNPLPSFDYFGDAAWGNSRPNGHYSFNLGEWHIIVLNDNSPYISITPTSPEVKWLKADLAANSKPCILAIWHQPLFYSAYEGGTPGYLTSRRNLWAPLYDARADLILNAHKHVYERYGLQDPDGRATPNGIRQIIVGTGGINTAATPTVLSPNAQVVNGGINRFGLLKLTLNDDSYAWQYIPVGNNTFTDQGTTACHVPSNASAAASTATVPSGVAGRVTTISVQARDSTGHALSTGGSTVTVDVSGANSTSAAVTDNGDGTYTAQYTPMAVGTDNLAIALDGTPLGGSPYQSVVAPKIVKVGPSANTQTVPVGTPVPSAPSVKVTDGGGTPIAGVTVTFTVLAGGGSVVPSSRVTDANGIATVDSWTVGAAPATNKVRAAVSTSSYVDFWAVGQ